ASVSEEWRNYFRQLENGERAVRLSPSFRPRSLFNPPNGGYTDGSKAVAAAVGLQDRVDQLIRAYRTRGHMIAQIDPLGLPRPCPPELEPSFYRLAEADFDRCFSCET